MKGVIARGLISALDGRCMALLGLVRHAYFGAQKRQCDKKSVNPLCTHDYVTTINSPRRKLGV